MTEKKWKSDVNMDLTDSQVVKWSIPPYSSRISCSGVKSAGPTAVLCNYLTQLKNSTPLIPKHAAGHDPEPALSAPFWLSISTEPCLILSLFSFSMRNWDNKPGTKIRNVQNF
jgi:hypothetical protein